MYPCTLRDNSNSDLHHYLAYFFLHRATLERSRYCFSVFVFSRFTCEKLIFIETIEGKAKTSFFSFKKDRSH